MRRWPVYGIGLAVLWLFVRGVELAPLPIVRELLIGLAFGLPLAFTLRRFYRPRVALRERALALPYAGMYVLVFVWELLTANLDVAYRVLSPSMPIKPTVVEVPLRVESDAAVTTIANSITLTPGTLTMDYDEKRHVFYVHALAAEDPKEVLEPIRKWEDYALRIFDEEREPGSPVPESVSNPGDETVPTADPRPGGDDRGD
ncbi:Na+/H+ antiporter subunit E [Haloarculaceae archaeon H-GB2-1]|nr:Na+/H+ antiporter subunit E [Haloarculaceae archaeon H-GB1-1]MEA5385917.1 Na+/H+ antiporter subunit E [Haloarculaceae archaeon H-GB11]MEA5407424.1 Na+/H+ antiporter subunit E [Haloarculaceae archaeon H-GB2-1]